LDWLLQPRTQSLRQIKLTSPLDSMDLHLDREIFLELLELDDPQDPTRKFSQSLLEEFYLQAENELNEMQRSL
jgi:hypothetical protein